MDSPLPCTLLDLLSNSLVLQRFSAYIPISSICALAATSKSLHQLTYGSPECFRYTDLSVVKSAVVPPASQGPIDVGGVNWRNERMDEALTEDEFYSGPLRGIFSKLARRNVLRYVHTLVLDRLSVPADLVREIVAEDRFNVRILSLRECKNLNERKLMQVLKYACRPSRPEGSPKLRGLYYFGPCEPSPTSLVKGKQVLSQNRDNTATSTRQNPQILSELNQRSAQVLHAELAKAADKWYQACGRLIKKRPTFSEWAETIVACEGIIFFDASLCRGPRHDVSKAYFQGSSQSTKLSVACPYLSPAIATIALGPAGCASCGSSPELPAVFGRSTSTCFPLLSPPPLHSSTLYAAQVPSTTEANALPPLYIRCDDCLKGRWCERCNKWWDEECYLGDTSTGNSSLYQNGLNDISAERRSSSQAFKPKMMVSRECFGCGYTCAECTSLYIRTCKRCGGEYCILDSESPSATLCDWCSISRRTIELY